MMPVVQGCLHGLEEEVREELGLDWRQTDGRAIAESAKDTLCRNVTIYGHCRYENKG